MKITVKKGEIQVMHGDLNEADWERYRRDVREAGATYNKATKRTTVGPDQLVRFGHAMASRGWNPRLTYSAVDTLKQRRDRLTQAHQEAEEIGKAKGLYPYQIDGVAFLRGRTHCLLADDMGLGKTVQALCALPENEPVTIVCPAGVKAVWWQHVQDWRPELLERVTVYNPDRLKEVRKIPQGTLIVDEAHYFKNPKAYRTRLLRNWAAQSTRVWLLTGTPLVTKPQDLWGVLESGKIGKRAFGGWPNFVRVFQGIQNEWGGYDWVTPLPESSDILSTVALRRVKSEVLDQIPAKSYTTLPIQLTATHRTQVETSLTEEERALLSGREAEDAAKDITKMSKARRVLAMAKSAALHSYIKAHELKDETNDDPLVVFSAHVDVLRRAAERDGWDIITGATAPDTRQDIVDAFQRGELLGLCCSIGAAGTGITLTRSSHMVFVDRSWSPSENDQAEDRICRIGQDRGCRYVDMIADHPLDNLAHNVNKAKRQTIEASVERTASTDTLLEQLNTILRDYE